ncbi:MAG: hypothetical protein R3D69_18165 [Xanthobacteraceae bacterium]
MNSFSSSASLPNAARRPRSNWLLILIACVVGAGAIGLIAYLLRPTWHAGGSSDPERLPISIGSALFNVPSDAIRMRMQRRAGPQERIDLAFDYPSLTPPAPHGHVTSDTAEHTHATNRIFLSISTDADVVTPQERARTIYPRYVDPQAVTQDGLTGQAFRDDTPYRGEDLFTADAPAFVARCTRDAMTAGTCLSQRRVDGASVTFRFARSYLSDWRGVAQAMDTLIARLQSRAK